VSITLERAPAPAGGADELVDGACLRRACAAFARVAAAADDTTDIDELLHVVARQVRDLVGVERCSIHLRDDSAGIFRGCVGLAGAEDLAPDIKRSLAGVPADGMTEELLRTRRPVIVPSAQDDPRTVKSTVRFWKIRSMMAVPMIFEDEVIGVIFLDDVDRPHHFTEEDAETASLFGDLAATVVMQAQRRVELRARVDSTERQIRALRRATAVDERLSDLVLEGRSLHEVLAALAEVLGKPCAVFGADRTRVACATPPGADDGIAPRLLERPYADHPEVQQALSAHPDSRAFVVGPLPAAGVLHRYVVAPIVLGDDTWGHLVVMEHKTRFTGGDLLMLRRAATLIALQVSTERKAIEAEWNAGSSLVSELLSGSSDDMVVRRRADRLGVRLDARRVVAFIAGRDPDPGSGVPDFRAVAAAFRRVAPGLVVHAASVHGGVAALIEVPGDVEDATFVRATKATLARACGLLRPASELVAAVSSVRADRDGYREAYTEARQVVECLQRFATDGGPSILSAPELGIARLLLATSDARVVARLAEQTFGTMLADETKADLVTTLCVFFDCMASVRQCAAQLGVHENTIRYRLDRVEELTGLAICRDPEALLQARIALLVLLLQGRLPATPAAAAQAREDLEVAA